MKKTNAHHDDPLPIVAIIVNSAHGYGREIHGGICDYIQENRSFMAVQAYEMMGRRSLLQDWVHRVDGVITEIHEPEHIRMLQKIGRPTVSVTGEMFPPPIPSILLNNIKIGQIAAEFFINKGFSHFAYLPFHDIWFSQQRLKGFTEAINQAGGEVLVCPEPLADDIKKNYPPLELSRWLCSLPKPVGLLTALIERAQQAVLACRRVGILVPEEVAILGVDPDELVCDMVDPPLSTINPGFQQAGYQAAALIDKLLKGQAPPKKPIVIEPFEIQERHSTDWFAVDDPDVVGVLRRIRRYATKGYTIEQIVEPLAISRRGLEKKFKRLMSRTLQEEIRRVRLVRVKELLAATALPLPDIAVRTGFTSGAYLSTAFHRAFEMTPSEFRIQSRQ